MLKKILWVFAALVLVVVGYVGYMMLTTKSHSPADIAGYSDSSLSIEVKYSRPYKKGRLIFGEEADGALVPFGMKWRTGANEATEIEFSADVNVNGQSLKAGRYSLYTIPGASEWIVVFNSKLGYWGAKPMGDPFDETLDVLRVPATVSSDEPEAEQFTILFTPADSVVNMHFVWDKTRATVSMQRQ
jgi:hypothetical protein